VLYGVSQSNTDRLQRVQNVLARVVVQAPSTISSMDIRPELHWLHVYHRISYKLSLLTGKHFTPRDPIIILLDRVPACDRRTDGQTDRQSDGRTDGHTDGIAVAITRLALCAVARKKQKTTEFVKIQEVSTSAIKTSHFIFGHNFGVF